MICDKCKEDILSNWEIYKTYNGIDEHHNPPQFMMVEWKGEKYNLCRDCHKELHHLFIVPIMNKIAGTLKTNGSEHWLWMKMCPMKRDECREAVLLY